MAANSSQQVNGRAGLKGCLGYTYYDAKNYFFGDFFIEKVAIVWTIVPVKSIRRACARFYWKLRTDF
jgi:hypothetical protein